MSDELIWPVYFAGVVFVAVVGGVLFGRHPVPSLIALVWPIAAFCFAVVLPVVGLGMIGAFIRTRFAAGAPHE